MKLYINELAPYEEKSQYHSIIKLGSDVNKQIELLQKTSKDQLKSRLSSTNTLISSQNKTMELIGSGFNELSYDLKQISQGLDGLQSIFEWGISEVVWQIELNNKRLDKIQDLLLAPLDTKSKELRKRGITAFENGWHEDALEDFLLSEKKNKYDFMVHISIGMIYLFNLKLKDKAIGYFEKAIKFSRPYSTYHTSFALLYKALILLDFGKTEDAEKCTQEAYELSPDFLEAYYQNSQYNALLKNTDKCFCQLRLVISKDIGYLAKVNADPFFDCIRNEINVFLTELRDNERKIAETKLERLEVIYNSYKSITSHIGKKENEYFVNKILKSEELIVRIKKILKINLYLDIRDINIKLADELNEELIDLISNITSNLNYRITPLQSEINRKEREKLNIQTKIEKSPDYSNLTNYLIWGSFVFPIVANLLFGGGALNYILGTIFLVIPVVSQLISAYTTISYFSGAHTESDYQALAYSIILYLCIGILYYMSLNLKLSLFSELKVSENELNNIKRMNMQQINNLKIELNELEKLKDELKLFKDEIGIK